MASLILKDPYYTLYTYFLTIICPSFTYFVCPLFRERMLKHTVLEVGPFVMSQQAPVPH